MNYNQTWGSSPGIGLVAPIASSFGGSIDVAGIFTSLKLGPVARRTAAIALLLTVILACASSVQPSWALLPTDDPKEGLSDGGLFVQGPSVRGSLNERTPLVAFVDFETVADTQALVEIRNGARRWTTASQSVGRSHRVALLGMVPSQRHWIRVRVENVGDGQGQTSQWIEHDTPPLPQAFPPLQLLRADPPRMEPGITLFAVNLWQNDTSMFDYGFLVALDQTGAVVWFCNVQDRIADSRVLSNGLLLYQHGSYRHLYEIDILGGDHRCWYASRTTGKPRADAIAVDVDTMHHETLELPNGNFLTLATELRRFTDFPTDVFDPNAPKQPAWVVCDEVVEFEPDTGRIVERFSLTDVMDTQRFGFMSLNGFWREKYNDFLDSPSMDWSHANSLQYLPDEDSILVSFRHLCCIVKFDWKNKKLKWILGDPDGWSDEFHPYLFQPEGDLQWFYHQHSPHVTASGTILMFDNGNYRGMPYASPVPASENHSRVVAYRIDEDAMTVRQVYSYGAPQGDSFYSPFFGEAEILPTTGNLLITDGGRIETEDGLPFDDVPGGRQWARIFEITGQNYPQKVFETVCVSPLGSDFGWSIYRANRYPGLEQTFSIPSNVAGVLAKVHPRNPVKKLNPLDSYRPVVVRPPPEENNKNSSDGS
jgi:arylsulfate sulfotransferase